MSPVGSQGQGHNAVKINVRAWSIEYTFKINPSCKVPLLQKRLKIADRQTNEKVKNYVLNIHNFISQEGKNTKHKDTCSLQIG